MKIGARLTEDNGEKVCKFTVWAPLLEEVAVEIVRTPSEAKSGSDLLPMIKGDRGYWQAIAPNIPAGTQYRYQLEGADSWPDPAADYQPEGVHGPSEVIDHSAFEWSDHTWQGIPLNDYIIYELHVGTFTDEGTFESAIARLPYLVELGITAVEIMPVAQFPGDRNWGYDGVFPFAVQNSYGGPNGLKQLVNACHAHGLAVVLDVVYNHFGPEGNYTGKYGPYTTDRYRTPWGNAINFDDAESGGVRNYFIQNALNWLDDYHVDALRLDAVHAIYDFGAEHFLQALSEAVDELESTQSRPLYLIAESDLNDPRLIRSTSKGGYQLDAQWSDDFHHALHSRLTDEKIGYYSDFTNLETLAFAIRNRFVYAGQYSPFRRRDHGGPALDLPSERFVVCSQNHDQVGNRMMGDRFSTLISFEAQKIAAATTILSPYLPLLFMGEEYGENAPFLYFVDHGEPDLIAAVRAGRKEEFKDFHGEGTPPDPAGLETLEKSTLNWPTDKDAAQGATYASDWKPEKGNTPAQQMKLLKFYKQLIKVRKACKIMNTSTASDIITQHTNDLLYYRRTRPDPGTGDLLFIINFGEQPHKIGLPLGKQTWRQKISSLSTEWSTEADKTTELLPEVLTAESTPNTSVPAMSFALYQSDI